MRHGFDRIIMEALSDMARAETLKNGDLAAANIFATYLSERASVRAMSFDGVVMDEDDISAARAIWEDTRDRIETIKAVRTLKKCSLGDAKFVVDSLFPRGM